MVWLAVNSPLSDNKHLLITEEQVVGVEARVGGPSHGSYLLLLLAHRLF